jgi:uncharacterized protein YodC (DUF2158 family)
MASGDELTYQWQRNGINIPGNDSRLLEADTILIIRDVQIEDAGMYKCIIFNGAGDNDTSNEATLIVSK